MNKNYREIDNYIGRFSTFKEARKNAREVAKISGKHWAYIEILKEKIPYYIVKDTNDNNCFDYYVHKDGRVCPKRIIENENKKWNRHPEQHNYSYPFCNEVRNRKPQEDKKSYKKEMNIGNPSIT